MHEAEQADALTLRRAGRDDVEAIVDLLQANEVARGGSLTGHFDHARTAAALDDMPVIVALRGERLLGVLLSGSIPAEPPSPVIAAMLRTYRGGTDAYLYGPICVAAGARGQGIAERLFARLKAELPGREGILFIRGDNVASIRAHEEKLGMGRRGIFALDGVDYLVLSYQG